MLSSTNPEWKRWIEANPAGNIFHSPAWSELLASCYGFKPFVLAAFGPGGGISAGIPVMELKSLLGSKRWSALPFTDHCAPLASSPGAMEDLLRGLSSQYREAGLEELEVRWELPTLSSAQLPNHHVLHLLDLDANPERVYSRLHSTHRRNIKTAQNSGLRIEQGNSELFLREFYRLHRITRRQQGMPTQPWRFFRLLHKLLLERDLGFIVLAYHETACLAASLFLKWQKTLTYKYGASTPDSLQYRPNNLVMWTAIRWGCENGYAIFDLGRTDNENSGLRRYKSGWGASETPLSYTVLSPKPVQERSGSLMNLMQKIIRISPTWVSQLTGELLYRFFG